MALREETFDDWYQRHKDALDEKGERVFRLLDAALTEDADLRSRLSSLEAENTQLRERLARFEEDDDFLVRAVRKALAAPRDTRE